LEAQQIFFTIKLKMEVNNNRGDEEQQLRRCERKRELNELTKNGGKPTAAAAGQEKQNGINNKNSEDGNELDLEVCTYLDEKKTK
jgi:hypothetical protein